KVLDNGLKVIIVPTGFPNIVSLQIPVRTGARNEIEAGKSGFAHFFEHMMFRGTEKYPPAEYEAILTKAGARQNAYTADDYTNYHTTFAKEDLEKILEIEADRFMNLKYSVEGFKTESRAVLGEYNKNSANPIRKLIEVQRDNAFTTHTYKHTGMGFIQDIEDMPNEFDYSLTFFDRFYRPEYTTIIVAGDVDPAEVMPLVEKYWGGWKRGSYRTEIPQEPEPKKAVYAHVDWTSPTSPYVTVAFHTPGFSAKDKDFSALYAISELYFGGTSDLYKKLVEQEQVVDQFFAYAPDNVDPYLFTIFARVKDPAKAVYVRDEILKTFALATNEPLPAQRLADAKANARYGFARTLDNTESIAAALASFVHYERRYETLNELYGTFDSITPADVQATAKKYFTGNRMVVTTLSQEPLPAEIRELPGMASFAPSADAGKSIEIITRKNDLPTVNAKLLFTVGSAYDPKGKEGLSTLAASMITEAGSAQMPISEISKAFYPMAASFGSQVDKEMTTFTGIVHRDNFRKFLDVSLPMLVDPGFREEDFTRLKDQQINALKQDLRTNNEEELGKERLQELIFRGTPYAHPVLGTLAGLEAITLDDVKAFVRGAYAQGNLTVGLSGAVDAEMEAMLRRELAKLPAKPAVKTADTVAGQMPKGIEVDIIEKDTRATAISFGHPIEVTRSHPDYVALYLARTWLGEHRSSMSHLYQRIRAERGMNYGDYAYIEAFPRGMYQLFPDPNLGRRAQIFEVWIRPVVPENAHMALRIAVHELENLVTEGLSQEELDSTRDYLMKNVFVMTARQNQQIGYALDSDWYGIPEYTSFMRDRLAKLTLADVNAAIRKHLSAKNLSVVMIAQDAAGLKQKLESNEFSSISYDADKPEELLAEDKAIGAKKLGITRVSITPVEEVFAK
ncbi:MAG TPA: pitrilysin family protein, partial [Thermoanaerobaculia bacterium]|nr:pitrilysin family protein [Thermoanaerobaculia bacterium]